MAPKASQKADGKVASRLTWHDEHVLMLIEVLGLPGCNPVGGSANGKMVKANTIWELVLKHMNELTPAKNMEIL